MTILSGPPPTPPGPPAGLGATSRRPRATWHVRVGSVVLAWLVADVLVGLGHPFVPAPRWLLVHLLALGAVSNAILIWSWHFTAAVLRLSDDSRREQALRLATLNVGALAAVVGVVTGHGPVVATGAVIVGLAALWHAVALITRLRGALPSRFGGTVRYYVAAGVALVIGATLAAVMMLTDLGATMYDRVVVAHAIVNVLGWVGLTILGTLVTLWPTMLRTRVAETTTRHATRALPVLAAGLVVGAGGALVGAIWLTALGVAVYAAGVGLVCWAHVEETRRRAPTSFATWSVLSGIAWLAALLVTFGIGTATSASWEEAAARGGWLTGPLLAGFVAQVLLGALSYLVPMALGGGHLTRLTTLEMERGGPLRLVVTNAALLIAVLPVPAAVRVITTALVLVTMAVVPVLAVRAWLVARRDVPEPGRVSPIPAPGHTKRGMGSAAVGVAVIALAVAAAVGVDPASVGIAAVSGDAGVVATGHMTRVDLTITGMRYSPGTVDVPAGDRLILTLHNTGTTTHDLVIETGAHTSRLSPGQSAVLDVGVVGRNLDGWCSVPGHRAMGMVLAIHVTGLVTGGTAANEPPMTGMDHSAPAGPSAADDIDLEQKPGPGFQARDARLAPAPAATTHRMTLTVRDTVTEVAPGVWQKLWTYNGTAPGPTLRGHVGDLFEITLVNDASTGHSIDFHAGALSPDVPMRTIDPGEQLTYTFTAARSGIWLYHCSTMPMSLHIANGMFGAVIIDPPGLDPVDAEYLFVQSEFYLGPQREPADPARIATGRPDLLAFNGYANQYVYQPVSVAAGDRVRIWVLDAGPNVGSAFHVVGGQFDTVFTEGAYQLREGAPPGADAPGTGGSQVLGLTPAQGGFVELTLADPGHYSFLTHAMSDAERGAAGVFEVTAP